MAVTQKQIAEKLGVSVTLVSRVLLGRAKEIGIASATIARVEKTAKALGYIHNAAALSLRGKSTHTIGVVVYNFNDLFFGALIKQIQIQAHKRHYSILLVGFLNRIPNGQDLAPLHKYAIDGLIILGSDMEAKWLSSFRNLPAARIGQGSPEEDSFKIALDEDDAARQLIAHFAAQNRKKVASLSDSRPSARLRQASLKRAAAAAGIRLIPVMSEKEDYFDVGVETTKAVLKTNPDVGALACNTDRIAMGALSVLSSARISVPGQVMVTGFDDIMSAIRITPAITTIHQSLEEVAEQAFQAIINPPFRPQTVYLPGKLVVRDT